MSNTSKPKPRYWRSFRGEGHLGAAHFDVKQEVEAAGRGVACRGLYAPGKVNSIEKVGDEIRVVADELSVWATMCGEQHALQTRVKEMERQQRRQRQRIFGVEDEIADKRELQQLQEQESDRSLVLPPILESVGVRALSQTSPPLALGLIEECRALIIERL